MSALNPLVAELRRRRYIGRRTLTRGEIPQRPHVGFQVKWGMTTVTACLAVIVIAYIVFKQTIHLLAELVIVLGALACIRSFREWIMPVLHGEPFDDVGLRNTPQSMRFLIGAAPIGVVAYAIWHNPFMVIIAMISGGLGFERFARAMNGKRLPPIAMLLGPKTDEPQAAQPDIHNPGPFGFWIGEATGVLANLGHRAGMKTGSDVTLNLLDAAKNIAVFGETGTGKTTRVMTNLLVQALDFDAGALIFDIRGDFHETVAQAGIITHKTVQRIGVGHLGFNLLEGLTPNTAAGFLEAAFRMLGQGEGDSGFWVSLAVARCQAALSVLNYVPGMYSLKGLYRYIFEKCIREEALTQAQEALVTLQIRAADGDTDATLDMRRLKGALEYESSVVPGYGEREQSGLNRTIETALARFADPELEDAFCTAEQRQVRLDDLLEGAVFVVNVPRERFKAAAQVVYLFIKERFFQTLNARAQMQPGPRKERPVLFLCDEYQQIASPGDAQFFDTSRALNVVGIVASQSMDAYLNALRNEHAAMTFLGNFANIIAFRSTPKTMEYLTAKLGSADVWKVTHSGGESSTGFFGFRMQNGVNDGLSTSEQRQHVLDAQLLRSLEADHAVALLTVNGVAFDDVIRVLQVTADDLQA